MLYLENTETKYFQKFIVNKNSTVIKLALILGLLLKNFFGYLLSKFGQGDKKSVEQGDDNKNKSESQNARFYWKISPVFHRIITTSNKFLQVKMCFCPSLMYQRKSPSVSG
jgi:hypothetical protein